MKKREEKLRAIFLEDPSIPDRSPEWTTLNVRDEIFDEIEFIRTLGEIQTWEFLPEDVADVLFKDMRGNQLRPQDLEDVPVSAIVSMALRLMRIYLTGANRWTRQLIPKVMQVNREKISRRMFMERPMHGVEMERTVEKAKEKMGYESDDNFDFDSVDFEL